MLEDLQEELRQFFFNNYISQFTSDFGYTFMDKWIFHQGGRNTLQSHLVDEILVILLKSEMTFINFKY